VGEDRTPPVRRTTVAEAAEVLGISAEAVRGRIRRGTLPVEREGGTVYVLVNEADQPRTTSDQPTDRTELLIAELQDRIRSLEEANRENRRIIAALTQRIPELEASQESRQEASTEATEQPGRVGPQTPLESPQEGARRPWWRRVFGG
jgi:flagellar motility protein MotE (MotC chaperone)